MPRRPRPVSRQRNSAHGTSDKTASSSKPKLSKRSSPSTVSGEDSEWNEEDEPSGSGTSGSDDCGDSDHEEDTLEDEDEGDMDAPRVAQWIDEDDLDEVDEDEKEQGEKPSDLKTLQDDLSGLPFGALRKAQRMLSKAEVASDESDESESEREEPRPVSPKGKEKAQPEWSLKPKKEIAKRANKHAPIEVTSKRPVTRKRIVVDVKTPQPRDPRFLPLAGEFSAEKFRKSYGFLAEAHKQELQTLQENLKRARKLLASSPRDTYEERASEVQRLELAVKRAESLVNKDRRDKIEEEALTKVRREEREKRKKGKGEWHMKKSDKRDLLVKARYEALAAEGGKRAVKKAIEKKQKKIGQKEKKSRPFGEKRRREGGDSSGGREKRRRVG
ncbi:putative rRNA biogenesis protein RRP36 [Lyophyllum shimeji]|uniref:rRNA biogenesis protein RRP36 n=1 Tax=Lyophyllum shimeji TaxID=47721 RepID=A0A9P3ULX8_LYOSH|nr:putative rRNA biogenesis protein RRP36 [Lyophyllum shimeji]